MSEIAGIKVGITVDDSELRKLDDAVAYLQENKDKLDVSAEITLDKAPYEEAVEQAVSDVAETEKKLAVNVPVQIDTKAAMDKIAAALAPGGELAKSLAELGNPAFIPGIDENGNVFATIIDGAKAVTDETTKAKEDVQDTSTEVDKLGEKAKQTHSLLQDILSAEVIKTAVNGVLLFGKQSIQAAASTGSELANSYNEAKGEFAAMVDEWKIAVGDGLLPVLTAAYNAANDLFSAFGKKSLSETFQDINKGFENNAQTIELNDAKAQALIETLSQLTGKQSLTAQETALWKGAVKELTAIYPSLAEKIGMTAGEFAESEANIVAETKALKENALEKATISALQGKLDAWAEATVRVGEAQAKYKASAAAYETQVEGLTQKVMELTGAEHDEARFVVEQGGTVDSLAQSYADLKDGIMPSASALRSLNEEIASGHLIIMGYKKEAKENERIVKETTASQEELAAALENSNDAFRSLGYVLPATTEQLEGFYNSIGTTSEGFMALIAQGQGVSELFQDLSQYRLDNFNQVKRQVESTFGTFEKAGSVRPQSAKNMEKAMESQIKMHERYQEAMQDLKDKGVDEDLLSTMGFSPESVAQMEALNKLSPENLTAFMETFSSLKTEQEQTAAVISETQLSVDETFQSMETAAQEAKKSFDESTQSIMQNAGNMLSSVLSDVFGAKGSLFELKTDGAELDASEWEPTVTVDDQASSVIGDVTKELKDLDGQSATVSIGVSMHGKMPNFLNKFMPHATGLDTVPYDGYPAILHRNEAVLTAAEADNWRKGARSAADQPQQPINLTINVNGNTESPYDVARSVTDAIERLRWKAT